MILTFDSVTLSERVENISFSLKTGELLALSGPSGAGKSTILSLAAGLVAPSSGTVERKGKFAFLFQESDLQIFENTVESEVGFALKCAGVDKAESDAKVREALESVGLGYSLYKDRTPYTLSGGEKKRLALASLIVMEPEILFLDEPTAGLDGPSAAAFINVLATLKEKGMSILMATHDANLIAECAERVLVLEKGRMTGLYQTAEYFEKYPDVSPVSELSVRLGLEGVYRFEQLIEQLGGKLC